MTSDTIILGIESSCDDTAAAILLDTGIETRVLSSVVVGQNSIHKNFGGVVPELAARAHAEKVDHVVEQALLDASVQIRDLNAVAATAGPGLIGGVVSGLMCAKGLATALGVPLIGVNHLAGHALTPRMTEALAFPYLLLLVSGGHCQFLIVHDIDRFTRIGGTIDDAPGEAFDKAARILGLGQPGGPAIEIAAKQGDPTRFTLPKPLLNRQGCDLSFSGLKTALLRTRDAELTSGNQLSAQSQVDLAASFQKTVSEILAAKSKVAFARYFEEAPAFPAFAVAGGVASNLEIRGALQELSDAHDVLFAAPPLKYCTDNAAMIAYAGLQRFRVGDTDDMTISARPRWPLDERSPAMLGSGKKGAKA